MQLPDVVAVDRPDVAEAQVLEDHPAHQARLDRVLDLGEEPFDRIADHRHAVEQFLDLDFQSGVELGRAEPVERFGQTADSRTDRHLVVVEDDDQVLLQTAGVVHGLEDDAAGKCPVADDRHDVPRLLGPQQVVAAAQAQGRSHAAAGVAGEKQVVVALGRVRVAHQAPLGPHRLELVVPAGDHLMGIHLVAGVPNQAIAAEIEAGVQGQGQLHHPQIGSEVCRPAGNQSAQRLAHFVGQRGQLLVEQALRSAGDSIVESNLSIQRFLSRTYRARACSPAAEDPKPDSA